MSNYQRVGLNSTANVKKILENTSRLSVGGRRIRLQLWGPEEVVPHGEGEHHLLRDWTQQNEDFKSNDLLILSDFVIVDMWMSTKIIWVRGKTAV